MTMYAGEEIKLTTSAKDFDHDTPLTDEDVQKVEVFGFLRGVNVLEQEMTFDATTGTWYYLWDTSDIAPGPKTVQLRFVYTTLTGRTSFEWRRLRLSKQPVAV